MMEIERDIKSKISSNCMCKTAMCIHHVGYVSVSDIQNAIKRLKPGKKDGSLNLSTDHIINGCIRLFTLLSLLFTAMLIHGHCPKAMLLGSMVPIPKINGTTNSENFRAITMSSIFVKLFDLVY